jgi:hypothetical protein
MVNVQQVICIDAKRKFTYWRTLSKKPLHHDQVTLFRRPWKCRTSTILDIVSIQRVMKEVVELSIYQRQAIRGTYMVSNI